MHALKWLNSTKSLRSGMKRPVTTTWQYNFLTQAPIALWESCNIGWKINQKVVNFGKWFLCQFSPKTWNFLHGAFLTPQKLEDEKVLTNLCMQRGKKKKNVKRVFFTDKMGAKKNCIGECYDICFLNICEKHPLVGENCIQSLKKMFYKYLTFFLDAAGWPNIWFLRSLSLSMIESNERCSKLFWNRMSMIDNRSFRPP